MSQDRRRQPLGRFPTGFERACTFAAWCFAMLFFWQVWTTLAQLAHARAEALAGLRESAWLLLGWIGAVRIGWSDPRVQ